MSLDIFCYFRLDCVGPIATVCNAATWCSTKGRENQRVNIPVTQDQGRIYSQQGPVQKKNVGPFTRGGRPFFRGKNGDLFV